MVTLTDIWSAFLSLPAWAHTTIQVVLILFAGWALDWVLDRRLNQVLKRNKFVDRTARKFIVRLVDIVVWAVTIVVALMALGVDPAALAGGVAVGGFVIGFALKDTLGNLAAGIMLLIYRPFHVGETVVIDGQAGDVVTLGMAMTAIKAGDGRIITMPNGKVLGGTIINHSREPIRRADVMVGIGYGDDIGVATQAILAAVAEDSRVLADPAPSVRITELSDSSVGLQVRPWVSTGDYWQAKADLHGTVKQALSKAGCSIPFPQRDVHVHNVANGTIESQA